MTKTTLPARYAEEARVGHRLVLAVDRASGRPVAVKLAEGPGPFAAAELARELEILAACEHPNIPKALHALNVGDSQFPGFSVARDSCSDRQRSAG